VLLCQAAQGNPVLEERLREAGRDVNRVVCYDTRFRAGNTPQVEELMKTPVAVTFTSASTVTGFVESLPGADFSQVLGCCIGQQTAAAAKRYGIRTMAAKQATMDSLIELILEKV
jgi:uroporphyrinogen III methyltransferase/synthase